MITRLNLVAALRWIVPITFAIVIFHAHAQAPATPPAETPKVSVASPKQPEAKHAIKLPANLVPDEQVSLYAKLPGYLDTITVDRGATVTKDQVIATLSAPEMQSNLALAEAKLRAAQAETGRAKANAKLAKTTHERLAKLHAAEPGAVTQEDVDDAEAKDLVAQADLVAADADVGVASAEVKQLKTLLDYLTVRAPFEGVATQRFMDPGALVGAGTGAKPIVEITRVNKLRLAFDLPERLAPFIKTGRAVKYSLTALPGKSFDAAITRRTDALASGTRTMRAEVDIDNSSGALSPGMYASVQIPLNDIAGISVVPSPALRTIDGKVCVLAVVDGHAKKLAVESLADAGTEVVVSGELAADTQVIVQGPASIADGQAVDIKAAG
ncbi:MAG: efflux RND transporter periplasmic adaptor subunit [Candidatus Hydrogenedentes bacterium]|nr:efflux RND transporter periplasmic adaptor subunit [Candidatus Hydrogenedentota bacterium]